MKAFEFSSKASHNYFCLYSMLSPNYCKVPITTKAFRLPSKGFCLKMWVFRLQNPNSFMADLHCEANLEDNLVT